MDWFPWGEEAFAQARETDRPIFLSVGYAACHWCHVMEHESFENESIAALLNQSFVAIKVDREERPDIDQIYMNAVQLMTGRGGWPMSVFLDHQLKPFYAGTYWPPTQKFGMPGFAQVLDAIADAWTNRRDDLREACRRDHPCAGAVGGRNHPSINLVSRARPSSMPPPITCCGCSTVSMEDSVMPQSFRMRPILICCFGEVCHATTAGWSEPPN